MNGLRVAVFTIRRATRAIAYASSFGLLFSSPCCGQVNERVEVGYYILVNALGGFGSQPTGVGVDVSMVEAPDSAGRYLPNSGHADIVGKNVTDLSGSNSGFSTHSLGTAVRYFGNINSMAPGVTDVDAYEVVDFIENVLKADTAGDPVAQTFKVQNHSWVAQEGLSDTGGPRPDWDLKALQSLDFIIDQNEMTTIVGINNPEFPSGDLLPIPHLLAPSYNAIAVGRTDALHSIGETAFSTYGPGRQKPEIVVPRGSVSTAAPVVGAAASMLHESGALSDAVLSEPMKAILLAGATKTEFPGWTRTSTEPLDDHYGAGELNIYNSYKIQSGGDFQGSPGSPASPVDDFGWDYETISAVSDLFFDFEVPIGMTGDELSIVLAWNMNITDSNASPSVFAPSESLVDLNLELFDSSTTFLGTSLDSSVSTIDNVEHIYLTDLDPGTYTLKLSNLSTSEARDFGLAWRLSNAPTGQTQGDYNGDGFVDGADYTVWLDTQHKGTLNFSAADGNLDGAVNDLDYDIWKANFGTTITTSVIATSVISNGPFVTSVPEPATGILLTLLSGFAWLVHPRRYIASPF